MHLRTTAPFFSSADAQKVKYGVIMVPMSVTFGGASAFTEALRSAASLPPIGEALSRGALQPTPKKSIYPREILRKRTRRLKCTHKW